MPTSRHALSLLIVALLMSQSLACEKTTPQQPLADLGASTSAPDQATIKKETPPETVAQALDAVVKHCKLDEKHIPSSCTSGENKRLQKMVARQRMDALPDLLSALESEDLPTRQVAAHAFKAYVPYFLNDAAKLDYTIRGDDKRVAPIDPELSKRIITMASKFEPDTDHELAFILDSAIDMATLASLDQEARDLLKRFEPAKNAAHEQLYYQGMKRVMRFGRMRFFEDVKAISTHEIPRLQLIAFEAPLLMNTWTAGESDTICKWAGEMLQQDKPQWNAGPARLMLRCNKANTWRNILLDEATRRYNKGELAQPFTHVLCRICAPAVHNQYPAGGKTVCDRGEKLFAKFTQDKQKKLALQDRKRLLQCMPEQWSNKATLSHLESMTKDREEEIQKLAQKLLEKYAPKKREGTN